MIGPRQILRLAYINVVLVRHGLDEIALRTHLLRPVRFLLHLLPWNWIRGTQPPRAVRLRRTLEDLGPIFIKFGQILSTRRDLLPEDIADEFASLQDRVPPFPGEAAAGIVRDALGRPVEEIFSEFTREPLASASIAQVHAARLKDGREVVVKVVRPGIEKVIRRDVSLLRFVADLAHRYWPDARRLHPREVVAEYEKTILDELDLQREAASASQLRRNFEGSDLLYVPEVHWEHTRRRVMVMERVSGIPISEIDALRDAGVDLRMLAERGVEIFFTQLMRHNFFHADMHPGNIFVDRAHPDRPSYIAVDFGIMGSLSEQDQRYLAENFLAFFNRDYRRVAELHVESKWVPPDTRIGDFEAAIRSVCEPNFDRPLKEISFRAGAGAAVSDRTALQHGGAAAARAAAEDAAQHRGSRPPALSGSRSVGDRETVPGGLDARATRRPGAAARVEAAGAEVGRDPARASRSRLRGLEARALRRDRGPDTGRGDRPASGRDPPGEPAHGAGDDRGGAAARRIGDARSRRDRAADALGGAGVDVDSRRCRICLAFAAWAGGREDR